LSGVVNAAGMLEPLTTDKLMEEVDRYLAAVDLFRELACEPAWRSDDRSDMPHETTPVLRTPRTVTELH
jgi:hypothetical protein